MTNTPRRLYMGLTTQIYSGHVRFQSISLCRFTPDHLAAFDTAHKDAASMPSERYDPLIVIALSLDDVELTEDNGLWRICSEKKVFEHPSVRPLNQGVYQWLYDSREELERRFPDEGYECIVPVLNKLFFRDFDPPLLR